MKDEDDDIQVYQRPWVGLTDEEVEQLADGCCPRIYWQAIEAKLKEKNT